MENDDFVNLHLHTMYSIQDAVIKPQDLVNTLKEYGQTRCALTDHSSCASWIDFDKEFRNNNIQPIFGNEFYCNKTYENKDRNRDHLIMLAMNNDGLVNIRALQCIAVEHFYYRPILSYDSLADKVDGIFCTSACSLGAIPKLILNNNIEEAESLAEYFADLFNNNFALELQFHPDYLDQDTVNRGLVDISDNYGIPLTVSCDSHFLKKDDVKLQNIVRAIGWHRSFNEMTALESNCLGNSEIIRLNAAMSGFMDMDVVNKAIKQTSIIADKCHAELEKPERRIPIFDKYNEFNKMFKEITW